MAIHGCVVIQDPYVLSVKKSALTALYFTAIKLYAIRTVRCIGSGGEDWAILTVTTVLLLFKFQLCDFII